MLTFLADENFKGPILRGLLRRCPELDVVRVQDLRMGGTPDPELLGTAARLKRILLTHDVSTMTRYAAERVSVGLAMPGVIQVVGGASAGVVIDDLILIATCCPPEEMEGQIRYVPI